MITTEQFIQLADEIVHLGLAKNKSEVARNIGQAYRYFTDLTRKGCRPNSTAITLMVEKYHVSRDYLETGRGRMFTDITTTDDTIRMLRDKIAELNAELAELQKKYIALLERSE